MSFRRLVSLTIALDFVLMLVTGTVLYIVPHGRVAYWTDWRLWGLSKTQWGELHITLALLMVLAGLCHVYLNWKPIVSYLRGRSREARRLTPEFGAALALVLLFTGLTLLEAPPVSWVPDLADSIKDRAGRIHGEPPYGHAEESRLNVFLRRTGLDEASSLAALDAAGIVWESRDRTILSIARANGITPQDVYLAMRPVEPRAGGDLPARAPHGLGRLSLAELGERLGVPASDLIAALASSGLEADRDDTLRNLASRAGDTPHGVYERIRTHLGSRAGEGAPRP